MNNMMQKIFICSIIFVFLSAVTFGMDVTRENDQLKMLVRYLNSLKESGIKSDLAASLIMSVIQGKMIIKQESDGTYKTSYVGDYATLGPWKQSEKILENVLNKTDENSNYYKMIIALAGDDEILEEHLNLIPDARIALQPSPMHFYAKVFGFLAGLGGISILGGYYYKYGISLKYDGVNLLLFPSILATTSFILSHKGAKADQIKSPDRADWQKYLTMCDKLTVLHKKMKQKRLLLDPYQKYSSGEKLFCAIYESEQNGMHWGIANESSDDEDLEIEKS